MSNLVRYGHPGLVSLRDFDQLFESFFKEPVQDTAFPKVHVRSTEDELRIQFALAGYPREALSVEVSGNKISVKGDKMEEGDNLFASRAFTWERKDVDNIWALEEANVSYIDGLLKISVPKKKELQPKLLQIG